MISTVTTTTVTTILSVGSIALAGILVLLTLLVQKELASASESRFAQSLSRVVTVAIVPLLLAFVAIVAAKVVEAIQ
jgi:hypothetical protein